MTIVRSLGLLLAVLLLSAASGIPTYEPKRIDGEIPRVPLAALLANPRAYDGKMVETEGFLSLEFENSALYPDREAYLQIQTINAVWVDRPRDLRGRSLSRLMHGYARIGGRFQAAPIVPNRWYSGAITDVAYIDPGTTRGQWAAKLQGDYWSWALRGDPRLWIVIGFAFAVPLAAWLIMSRRP